MSPVSMDAPAELRRRAGRGGEDVVVARGPLVIMAHGLLALDVEDRAGCWITSADRSLNAGEVADLLRRWQGIRRH